MPKPSPAGHTTRARHASRISTICVLLTLAASLLLPSVAMAATAPPFDPTLVISDDAFRASYSMGAADIQSFLDRQTGVLDTTLVLSHSTNTTEPVSTVLWEVSQEFSINPKVLLVTLQKEQGLLTKTAPTQTQLDWALGFGCYDGSTPETRDPKYKGLGNQIWYAARALDSYAQTTWYPGLERTICVNCVTQPYTPNYHFVAKNLATYKLYVYTPHSHGPTPDIYGGNYLFWVLYWRYFDEGPLANPAIRPVFRFFNKQNGSHFYTASDSERITVIQKLADVYKYEGPAYYVNTGNPSNNLPLYRFYNPKTGSHFYTASEAEKNDVIARLSKTFSYEGPVYNVSASGENATPMYRFYNKRNGSHFYTTSDVERDSVIATLSGTYNFEGIAYYIGN